MPQRPKNRLTLSGRFQFSSDARLRKRWEFNNVYRMGCKKNTPHFLFLYSNNDKEQSRLGVTVSRKVGNAIIRNRVKRLIREFFRKNSYRLNTSLDLSVIAKRGSGQLSTNNLWNELEQMFK